ncbi:mandelate racemase [Cladophialophora psammophila CBS 110553]|uniref:Mandelate racemase n=1 Tax=Cladophialophora psammophila CBS 110553 TaxID=1182543 RepID=W9WRH5_9EURO|nr:mandelate racemase [Cladophialophora psammophila CBS 110553]EXJ67276.1 mandelate racemase [Cladophialophora psammophila CBS 110553]
MTILDKKMTADERFSNGTHHGTTNFDEITIQSYQVHDLRFPTSLTLAGSDAMNGTPDYSAAYIVLGTNSDFAGHGFSFTIGRGNDLVCEAARTIAGRLVGKRLAELTSDMGKTWHFLVSDSQLRWVGPEKGVTHLGLSACVNALWDLWGRAERKPVWKLIADMKPEEFVRCIDFRYIEDAITPQEAIALLEAQEASKLQRLRDAENNRAVPAYSTEAGWLGYSDDKMRKLMKDLLAAGHDKFKLKVGKDLEDDKRRCRIAREVMGDEKTLMVDANQVWGVSEAIQWMLQLAEFKPAFIEEPTSPDDILGHAAVRKALKAHGIGVATGEMCHNRVMFKQLLQAEAIDVCQIDACRLGGVNEVLAVLVMAKKFGVPVVPHSGGIGLNEYTQHLSLVDYLCVSGERSMLENITTYNHVLTTPLQTRDGFFVTPSESGYSVEFREAAIAEYSYPEGTFWCSKDGLSIIDGGLN